jgi:cytoskeletal protein CcmA (bactofilin family)
MLGKTNSAKEMAASPKPETLPAKVRVEAPTANGCATIGSSIVIHGDVSGEEDLLIEGRVEGKVELAEHSLVVGAKGKVKADVYGRSVTIEGELEGNLCGGEQVIIRKSGRVRGDIVTPRMIIEDGATLTGRVDMDIKARSQPVGDQAATRSVVPFSSMGSPQPATGGDRTKGKGSQAAEQQG